MNHPASGNYPAPHEGEGPGGGGTADLHQDQAAVPEQGDTDTASDMDEDDPHKAEKLTKAGRDFDPSEGSD